MSRLSTRFEKKLATWLPGWHRSRAQARYEAKQLEYLAAGYDMAAGRLQSRNRSSLFRSEDGMLSQTDLDTIRETSNECARNNPLYSSYLRRGCDNIIGTGLTVNPKTSDTGLNDELRAGFEAYTAKGGAWDATRTRSLGEQQRIVLHSLWREGDLLAYRSDEGWQHFQGGQMGTPMGYDPARGRIIAGVQKDAFDRPDRYWVSNVSKYGYIDAATAKGLRADLCLHVGNFEWLNQTRALPIYWNALDKFDDFFRYIEAELLGAIAAACTVLEINSPHANALAALGLTKKTSTSDMERLKNVKIAPAQVVHTLQGEKINAIKWDRPNQHMPDYLRANMRILGIPIGMPLEIGLMDFTETNFAAAKMAINQAALTFLYWRMLVDVQYVGPIYTDYVRTQQEIKIPASVKNAAKYEILPPKADWLDAYKEALAINAAIEGGWETRLHAVKEAMNREMVDVVREQAEEMIIFRQVAKEKGVKEADLLQYARGLGKEQPGGLQAMAEAVAEAVAARIAA